MTLDVSVVLETLFCDKQYDGWVGGSEPYLWPFIVAVTSNPSGVKYLHEGPARLEIAQSMNAGDQRQIFPAVGEVRFQLPRDTQLTDLILLVALLEHDSTPNSAITKGFTAFNATLESELRIPLLQELEAAQAAGDSARVSQIISDVRGAVTSAVTDAIAADEGWRAIFTNNDDIIDAAFLTFSANRFTHVIPSERFTLRFARRVANPPHTEPPDHSTDLFRIDGRIEVVHNRDNVVDLCQSDVDRLKAAEDALKSAEVRRTLLQRELQRAAPPEKAAIAAQLEALGVQIDGLIAARDAAAAALKACRDRFTTGEGARRSGAIPVT